MILTYSGKLEHSAGSSLLRRASDKGCLHISSTVFCSINCLTFFPGFQKQHKATGSLLWWEAQACAAWIESWFWPPFASILLILLCFTWIDILCYFVRLLYQFSKLRSEQTKILITSIAKPCFQASKNVWLIQLSVHKLPHFTVNVPERFTIWSN